MKSFLKLAPASSEPTPKKLLTGSYDSREGGYFFSLATCLPQEQSQTMHTHRHATVKPVDFQSEDVPLRVAAHKALHEEDHEVFPVW